MAKFVQRDLGKASEVSRGRVSWTEVAGDAAVVIVALVGGYVALGWGAEQLAAHIPEEDEARLFAEIDPPQVEEAPPDLQRAQALFSKLTGATALRPLPYRLVVVDHDQANAFALPGGWVAVTPELLASVESETGLAMVLAHELGHHQHRHTLRRMGRTLAVQLALGFIGLGNSGLTSGAVAVAESSHSRDQEREADAFGIQLVQRALGTTDGALEFFEDALEEERQAGAAGRWTTWASTHPMTSERIEQLRGLAERAGG